jgi:hypothetical protein
LTAPTADPDLAWVRYREYHRAFVQYHPLHSLILAGLHGLGMSWEAAWAVLSVVGAALIGVGVGLLLLTLLGPGAAGIGLLLLAPQIFPVQGLHYIVPSSLALGLALFLWAGIMHWGRRAGPLLVGGTLLLVGMHTMGRIYALAALALWLVVSGAWRVPRGPDDRRDLRRWGRGLIPALLAAALVGLSFLLPLLITRPEMRILSDPPPPNWTVAAGLAANLGAAAALVSAWAADGGGPLIVGVLLSLGLLTLAPRRRLALGTLLGLLLALSAAAQIYLLPRYPGDMFIRLWVALAIVLTGLLAMVIWAWGQALLVWLTEARRGLGSLSDPQWLLNGRGWRLLLLIALGLTLARHTAVLTGRGLRTQNESIAIQAAKQNVRLDAAQPETITAAGCGRVAYTDEVPLHFFLSRGLWHCDTVFLPALADAAARAEALTGAQWGVAWNPSTAVETSGRGALALASWESLDIAVAPRQSLADLRLLIVNPGPALNVPVYALPFDPKARPLARLRLTAGAQGWERLKLPPGTTGVRLTLAEADRRFWIDGLRLSGEAVTFWPWDQDVRLTHYPSGGAAPRPITFTLGALFPEAARPPALVSDVGATVLVQWSDKE